MHSGNGTCSGPPGGCQQDSPEGSCGAHGTAGTQFLQPVLLSGESDGGWRTIIYLSSLNNFITITKFKMETVASVLRSVR